MFKLISIFLMLMVMAFLCTAVVPLEAASESAGSELLQFTGGGHVLGFSDNGIYVAGGDHAMNVVFVNAAPAKPVWESAGGNQKAPLPLEKVTYNNVWEDIDVAYTATADGIVESTYYLRAAASADSIRLRYNRPVSLDVQGNLVIRHENGNMIESAPVAWQEIGGIRRDVSAKYVICDGGDVGIALAGCESGHAVTIDPTLTWNTFLGSSGSDTGWAIAVDSTGNIYVAGTSGADWGDPVREFSLRDDAFVAKLNSSGMLQWNTFLGGDGDDVGWDVAVDHTGNVYIIGDSNADWGAPVRHYGGGDSAFVAKLDGSNGGLQWNTFLGGSGWDYGRGIAADSAGSVCVTGYSFGEWGLPKRHFSGHPPDAFAANLDGSGNLMWNTFLGGAGDDFAHDLATDPGLNIYIAGYSGVEWGSPVRQFTPSGIWYDSFTAKLDSDGELLWNTFLGGSGRDECFGITVDAAGNSYSAGKSDATWGDPVRSYSSGNDAFVSKVDGSGRLTWNTFLGGAGDDGGNGIAIDAAGNVFLAGSSSAAWGDPIRPFTGDSDGFTSRLTNAGGLLWNSFLGGDGDDTCNGIAVDSGSNVAVSGISDAAWGSPVRAFTPGSSGPPEPHPTTDAFAARIIATPPTIRSFVPTEGGNGTVVVITGANFTGTTSVTFGGIPAASYTVNSSTQITVVVGAGETGVVEVTNLDGTAASTGIFTFTTPSNFISTNVPHGAGLSSNALTPTPQGPVYMPCISVSRALLSATSVAPGSPVTVTADLANSGSATGSSIIKVFVNGDLENSLGVSIDAGGSKRITFTISRDEPGIYGVSVGGTNAGSFTVERLQPDILLIISGALVIIALGGGMIYIVRRKPYR